eukprot:SAG11_NODE_1454_length_4879_cov_4.858577_5_plen_252_part_00
MKTPMNTPAGRVTAEDLEFFRTFGFLHLRSKYTESEMRTIIEEADATVEAIDNEDRCAPGGRPEGGLGGFLPGRTGRNCSKFVEESEVLTSLLVEDPRIFELVSALLGQENFVWTTSNHIEASPAGPAFPAGPDGALTNEHGWHSDIAGVAEAAIPRVKVMIYLTPTTRKDGALLVLPGTQTAQRQADPGLRSLQGCHGMNTTTDPEWARSTFGVKGADVPSHAVEAMPGDIVVWQLGLYHAVFNHAPDRR